MKKVRIALSPKDAKAYKEKEYFVEVVRRLLAKRNELSKKIARLKKKVGKDVVWQIEQQIKNQAKEELKEAVAMVKNALDRGLM
jgi:hypothetical protein